MSEEKKEQVLQKPARITLHWLLKNDLPVWVVNRTGGDGVPAGIIALQSGKGMDSERFTIDPGEDPICLTDRMDQNTLKNCKDLFVAINSGALELLDPDDAELYYQENAERLEVAKKKLKNTLDANLGSTLKQIKSKTGGTALLDKMKSLCMRMQHDVISEKEAFETVYGQKGLLGESELKYLMNNAKYNSVRDWASEQLMKL